MSIMLLGVTHETSIMLKIMLGRRYNAEQYAGVKWQFHPTP